MFLVLAVTMLTACVKNNSTVKDKITVSILPQKYLIEQIAGDLFEINVMIPPGASPATYEPSPKQMQDLSDSKIYFRIGHIGFEKAWMKKIKELNPDLVIIDQSVNSNFIYSEEEKHGDHIHKGIDPHIWLSVNEMQNQIQNIFYGLIQNFPEIKSDLKPGYTEFKYQLDSLNLRYKELLNSCSNKKFIIYHPALSYFARDYNLVQLAMEIEGKEPNPADMKKLIDFAKENQIKAIFIQEEFNKENAVSLSKELDAEIIQINPLAYDWIATMNHISSSLKSSICPNN